MRTDLTFIAASLSAVRDGRAGCKQSAQAFDSRPLLVRTALLCRVSESPGPVAVEAETDRTRLLAFTVEPRSEREIIAGLGLQQGRARALLAAFVEEGVLERRARQVRYLARVQMALGI